MKCKCKVFVLIVRVNKDSESNFFLCVFFATLSGTVNPMKGEDSYGVWDHQFVNGRFIHNRVIHNLDWVHMQAKRVVVRNNPRSD